MAVGAALASGRAQARRLRPLWRRLAGEASEVRRPYVLFALPAMVVVSAVIVFPWLFTLFMSVHDWKIGQSRTFVGLENYARLLTDERFLSALVRTIYYTALAVVAPLVLGTASALVFHKKFPLRGLLRGIFILPMMATPVAVA